MKWLLIIPGAALAVAGLVASLVACIRQATPPPEGTAAANLYGIPATGNDGQPYDLGRHRGQVLLVVNTASECGYTPQYGPLQDLHERYAERGFSVIAMPSNDFLGQEPGSDTEIKAFCESTYGVTFPLLAKAPVTGPDAHPLFRWLCHGFEPPVRISWNFNKFLIGPDGRPLRHFGTRTAPDDPELLAAVEAALAEATDR